MCLGLAASMGSLLLAAGQKGLRFALPNARILVHQPKAGFEGQVTDIMLHAQEILNLKKRLNEIYMKHTGQPLQKIEEALERDFFMTAETAKDFGLVDKVIDHRPEIPPLAPVSRTDMQVVSPGSSGPAAIVRGECPLYPQKRTLELGRVMSALCHKRTSPFSGVGFWIVLMLGGGHDETSPPTIPPSASRRRRLGSISSDRTR